MARFPRAWEIFLQQKDYFPVIVKSIERIHDSTWSMEMNMHDHYELVYMKKGVSVFSVGRDKKTLEPNDMIIIKPRQRHKFSVKSDKNCEFIVLSFFFRDNNGKNMQNTSPDDFIDVTDAEQNNFIYLRLTRKNEIVNVLESILHERDRELEWRDIMSRLLIMELFVFVSRYLKHEREESIKKRSLKMKELLEMAKEYMDNNYKREIALADVAKYVYLSESYFAHAFKEEFGISPKRYLLNIRVEASKHLLADTDMKISDIALSVGFSSQQRYNDIFRKFENITPLKYRKTEKQNKVNKEL
ncbi:MAG: helix-turn-helix domain-containing protein [Oscillospiraceae bacterium]|nr:helix-turn-helix domain-containing protein [Oscillospiraceae bacterium]